MFCWHKWTKWSGIKNESWTRITYVSFTENHFIKTFQDRTCEKCGKYQKRYINE